MIYNLKFKIKNLKLNVKSFKFVLIFFILHFSFCTSLFAQETSNYVSKAWAASGGGNFDQVYRITGECIEKFSQEADNLAKTLSDFPSKEKQSVYQVMNDVATCYFIRAEALVKEGVAYFRDNKQELAEEKFSLAKQIFLEVIEKYPYAQAWDPRGWFWSIKEASEKTVDKIEKGEVVKTGVESPAPVQKEVKITLHDKGVFPVDYTKYGEFVGIGTKEYKYVIKDPVGLSKAVGEGIYPNTSSIKFDPNFIKVKKELASLDHWKLLNKRDLSTAFYKWNLAPEPQGVKQFYIGDLLERSGLIKQAIKAYYAILVHFPQSIGWTYWQTPWYIGKVALYRIKFLIEKYPQLNLKLNDAYIEVINGFDNQIRNDGFIVNPGKLTKKAFFSKFCSRRKKRELGDIVLNRGGDKIQLVKYESGDWQLIVDQKPFIIKGITYSPTRVGESPDEGTLANWTIQDTNNNGIIDAPYEAWVDKNKNNIQDKKESLVGDFQLLKEMGTNCIRVYHQPVELNKDLFRQMYQKYGIYIILGDFLGKYALGSKASWQEGTDYDNPTHKENMLDSVRRMVLEFKDEPYVLMWILGNENVYGIACNADKKPRSFFKFANCAAQLIKELDPLKRPVAIASGDLLYLDIFAQECPDIDIFGTNVYRGHHGFLDLWDEVKRIADKPAMITEYGCSSYSEGYTDQESQDYQAMYHRNAWWDISYNSCGYKAGNALGGVAFEWLDEWWKAYEPSYHDRKGLFAGPFLDGYMHEEWLGVCSQGNGSNSPFLRHLKKAYFAYQQLWSDN